MLDLKVIRDETRRANGPKTCILCGRPIGTGDNYVRRLGVVPGVGRRSLHVHQVCLDYAVADNWDDLDWECNDPTVFAALVDLSTTSGDTVSEKE